MGLIIKNGVIYNGAESEPVVYSLDEREIGVWIDGKPLYQKVWVFNSPIALGGSFSTVANIDSTNIEDVVHVYAMHEDGTGYGDINADPTRNNHTLLGLRAYDTRYIIKLILQYTKISDTPGSGTWTPSGVKSEHYSTNEHVVGTWIGETLYEKSYHVSSLSTTYQVVDSNITSSNAKIRDCKIGGYKVGGGYQNAQYANGFVSSSIFSRVILAADGVRVGMEGSFSESITDFDFTIRYTKIIS